MVVGRRGERKGVYLWRKNLHENEHEIFVGREEIFGVWLLKTTSWASK